MTFNTQEFSALGQAQFEKAVRLSSIFLNGAERLATAQLDSAFKQLAGQAQAFQSLSQIKDPKALIEFQSSLTQPTIDQAYSAARGVYETAVATQKELSAFVEEQVAENSKTFLKSLDTLTKNAPAGSEVAVNAFKSMVSQSSTMLESASRAAKKVGAEIAEASVQAATQAATHASQAAAQASKAATQVAAQAAAAVSPKKA